VALPRTASRLWTCVAALAAILLTTASGCATRSPGVPPLADAQAGERLVGKLVWADLFTPEVEATRDFYAGLFGWEWRRFHVGRSTTWVASLDGRPLAGLVQREPPPDSKVRSVWVAYISSGDAEAAVRSVAAAGGRTLRGPVDVPRRGEQAIVTDAEGAVFGVLRSDGGDPADYRAEVGEWIWAQLFSRNVDAAVAFYTDVFGYEAEDATWTEREGDWLLVAAGHARASVGPLPRDSKARPLWLGFVRVADAAASVARAEALGGRVLVAPRPGMEPGAFAVVADPGGAAVGLLEWSYDDAQETAP
jgi:predicted enzyme related to lactoylglutathione lyase